MITSVLVIPPPLEWHNALRYPIEGLTCHLKFDDKVIVAKTDVRGMLPKIITANIASAVEVWVENKASALKK